MGGFEMSTATMSAACSRQSRTISIRDIRMAKPSGDAIALAAGLLARHVGVSGGKASREVDMRNRCWMIGLLLAAVLTTSALAKDMTARQVAEAYLAAWNAHDPGAAAALMADDVTYLDVTVGEPQKGR